MSNRVFPLPAPIHKKQEKLSYYPPFSDGKKRRNSLKRARGEGGKQWLCVCECVVGGWGESRGGAFPLLLRKQAESNLEN